MLNITILFYSAYQFPDHTNVPIVEAMKHKLHLKIGLKMFPVFGCWIISLGSFYFRGSISFEKPHTNTWGSFHFFTTSQDVSIKKDFMLKMAYKKEWQHPSK